MDIVPTKYIYIYIFFDQRQNMDIVQHQKKIVIVDQKTVVVIRLALSAVDLILQYIKGKNH